MYSDDDNGLDDDDEFVFQQYAVDDSLDGLSRLERYHGSDFNLQRLVLVKDIYDTAVEAGFKESYKRMIPLLKHFVNDSEYAVRQIFAQKLYPLATFFLENADDPQIGYNELIINTFIPFTFELVIDKKQEVCSAATESLVKIAEMVKKEHLQDRILAVVQDLGQDDRVEEYRIAAAKLYNELAPIFGEQLCRETVVKAVAQLAEDSSLVVRKTVSQNLDKICTIIGTECTVEKVLPFFLELAKDDIWGVRKSCVESLPSISKFITGKIRSTVLTELFESFSEDVSRWVKMEAYKQLGPFIATFKGNEVSDQLIKLFTDMAFENEHNDSDLIEFCAFNFPAIVLTIGKSRWNLLEKAYTTLVKDVQWKVRKSLAYSLHIMAEILETEITEKVLFPAFVSMSKDMDEIKIGICTNLSVFMKYLTPESQKKALNLMRDNILQTDNWRIKREIAQHLGDIALLMKETTEVKDTILPLVFQLIDDPFSEVRAAAVIPCGKIFRAFEGDEESIEKMINFFESMSKSTSCFKRQTFISASAYIYEDVDPKLFEAHFLPRIIEFASDKVPNIRLALAKLLNDHFLQSHWKDNDSLISCREELRKDPDRDVKFFSNAAEVKMTPSFKPKVLHDRKKEDSETPLE